MSKKKKKKDNKKPTKFGGLFIKKLTDKSGRNYYLDKSGKRRKGVEYNVQWSKTGRVNKASFERAISEIDKHEIKDTEQARLIADDFEILRRARPMRKKEIEILQSETTGTNFFYQATDTIRDAIAGGAKIKILTPTGDKFMPYSDVKAMEKAHQFIDAIGASLKEIQEASTEAIESPMIQFNFQHDIKDNTFYLDFRNISGMEDFTLLQELIRDNFDA